MLQYSNKATTCRAHYKEENDTTKKILFFFNEEFVIKTLCHHKNTALMILELKILQLCYFIMNNIQLIYPANWWESRDIY